MAPNREELIGYVEPANTSSFYPRNAYPPPAVNANQNVSLIHDLVPRKNIQKIQGIPSGLLNVLQPRVRVQETYQPQRPDYSSVPRIWLEREHCRYGQAAPISNGQPDATQAISSQVPPHQFGGPDIPDFAKREEAVTRAELGYRLVGSNELGTSVAPHVDDAMRLDFQGLCSWNMDFADDRFYKDRQTPEVVMSSGATEPIPIKTEKSSLSVEDHRIPFAVSCPTPIPILGATAEAERQIELHRSKASASEAGDSGMESMLGIWKLDTGEDVRSLPPRRRRTAKEIWTTGTIRNLGGACPDCKRNHRACKIEHLIPKGAKFPQPDFSSMSEADATASIPSPRISYGKVAVLGSIMAKVDLDCDPTPGVLPPSSKEDLLGAGGQFLNSDTGYTADSIPRLDKNGQYRYPGGFP